MVSLLHFTVTTGWLTQCNTDAQQFAEVDLVQLNICSVNTGKVDPSIHFSLYTVNG